MEPSVCLCGHGASKVIAERDGYGLRLPTVMCLRCGLLRSEPRLDESAWRSFVAEDLPKISIDGGAPAERLFEEQVSQGEVLTREMPSLLEQVETVYEVGSSAGGRLAPLAKLGKKVSGCDRDERLVAFGCGKGLDLVAGGAMLFVSWVVDRMRDPLAELRDAVRLVKPGGMMIVLTPGVRQIEGQYRGNILRYLDTGRLYHFCESTLRFLLSRIGLEVVLCDESIIAAARRPGDWTPETLVDLEPNSDEPAALLLYLAALEREYGKRHAPTKPAASPLGAPEESSAPASMLVPQISIKEPAASAPIPLGTSAGLRVMAWPDYTSPTDIEMHLRIAEPMYGKPDACMCLRYDANLDPPMAVVQSNLQAAFSRIGRDENLNVLMVDDDIPSQERTRLGSSLTAAILVNPDVSGPRADFIRELGCPLITGK
jgi:SAM-dependent methyltransferase